MKFHRLASFAGFGVLYVMLETLRSPRSELYGPVLSGQSDL